MTPAPPLCLPRSTAAKLPCKRLRPTDVIGVSACESKRVLERTIHLKATQDPATGLWYQVTDQGAQADNWLETSASALFTYALKRGVKEAIIGSDYDAVASAGWEGVKRKVLIAGNTVTVQGAVGGMSVLSSYAAYVGAKSLVADNVPHGLAAVLFAASELEY